MIRRVYVVVRNPDWGMVPSMLTNLRMQVKKDSFRINFEVDNQKNKIHFTWKGSIEGDTSGKITFAMSGSARSTFLKNHIGLCLLFPASFSARKLCWGISQAKKNTHFSLSKFVQISP